MRIYVKWRNTLVKLLHKTVNVVHLLNGAISQNMLLLQSVVTSSP